MFVARKYVTPTELRHVGATAARDMLRRLVAEYAPRKTAAGYVRRRVAELRLQLLVEELRDADARHATRGECVTMSTVHALQRKLQAHITCALQPSDESLPGAFVAAQKCADAPGSLAGELQLCFVRMHDLLSDMRAQCDRDEDDIVDLTCTLRNRQERRRCEQERWITRGNDASSTGPQLAGAQPAPDLEGARCTTVSRPGHVQGTQETAHAAQQLTTLTVRELGLDVDSADRSSAAPTPVPEMGVATPLAALTPSVSSCASCCGSDSDDDGAPICEHRDNVLAQLEQHRWQASALQARLWGGCALRVALVNRGACCAELEALRFRINLCRDQLAFHRRQMRELSASLGSAHAVRLPPHDNTPERGHVAAIGEKKVAGAAQVACPAECAEDSRAPPPETGAATTPAALDLPQRDDHDTLLAQHEEHRRQASTLKARLMAGHARRVALMLRASKAAIGSGKELELEIEIERLRNGVFNCHLCFHHRQMSELGALLDPAHATSLHVADSIGEAQAAGAAHVALPAECAEDSQAPAAPSVAAETRTMSGPAYDSLVQQMLYHKGKASAHLGRIQASQARRNKILTRANPRPWEHERLTLPEEWHRERELTKPICGAHTYHRCRERQLTEAVYAEHRRRAAAGAH